MLLPSKASGGRGSAQGAQRREGGGGEAWRDEQQRRMLLVKKIRACVMIAGVAAACLTLVPMTAQMVVPRSRRSALDAGRERQPLHQLDCCSLARLLNNMEHVLERSAIHAGHPHLTSAPPRMCIRRFS